MDETRAPVGLLISSLGAAVLAVSVFVPWYGVSITPSGALTARQELGAVAQQYGTTAFQAREGSIEATFSSLTGRQVATVSAHRVLKNVSLILIVLAGVALLASLLRLADMRGLLWATGGQISLLGMLAAGAIVFRMIFRPGTAESFFSLSPIWGAWLSLGSALTIVAGGLIAGSGGMRMRVRRKVGPGPPPLGRVLN